MIRVLLTAFLSGSLFGLGLIIAGMADPSKVLAFLDIAGAWNPSLAFVMVGAIGVSATPFFIMRSRQKSLLGLPIQWPMKNQVDRPLIIGSLLFGIGWGIAGICPGPSLVLLGMGNTKSIAFIAAMIVGILLTDQFNKRRTH